MNHSAFTNIKKIFLTFIIGFSLLLINNTVEAKVLYVRSIASGEDNSSNFGDTTLLISGSNEDRKCMLIDLGSQTDNSLIDFIENGGGCGGKSLKDRTFDILITHYHDDHIGRVSDSNILLQKIVQNYNIGNLYLPKPTTEVTTYAQKGGKNWSKYWHEKFTSAEFKAASKNPNINIRTLTTGDTFTLGHATAKVVYQEQRPVGLEPGTTDNPNGCKDENNTYNKAIRYGNSPNPAFNTIAGYEYSKSTGSSTNNASLLTMFTVGNKKYLNGGDIEIPVENVVLGNEYDIKADVLKLNHHGFHSCNANSNSTNFLNKVAGGKKIYIYYQSGYDTKGNGTTTGNFGTNTIIKDIIASSQNYGNVYSGMHNRNFIFKLTDNDVEVTATPAHKKEIKLTCIDQTPNNPQNETKSFLFNHSAKYYIDSTYFPNFNFSTQSGTFTAAEKASTSVITKSVNCTRYKLYFKYNMNGGYLDSQHGSEIGTEGDFITRDGSTTGGVVGYAGQNLTAANGIANYNYSGYINIKKDGYKAKENEEWNTKANGSGTSFDQDKMYLSNDFSSNLALSNQTVTLYVNWIPNRINIKINKNGGSLAPEHGETVTEEGNYIAVNGSTILHSISYGNTLGQNGLYNYNNSTSVNILKTGYHVTPGEEYKTSGGKIFDQVTQYAASEFCDATSNDCTSELLVNWVANTYTIKYNANGGTGTMSDTSMTYGTAKPLTENAFTKEGYTFAGWNTKADGTGTNYSNKQSVNNLTATNNGTVTLYAKWTPITYKIVYNSNGGTGTMADTSMTYDVAKNLTTNSFTRTGYTFNGWNTKTDGTGNNYSNEESVNNLTTTNNGTVTLYAKWTPISYTIKFNNNGGNGTMADLDMTYGVAKKLTENTFTKTGSTFAGWNTKADGSGNNYTDKESVNNLTTTDGEEVTLYAKWIENGYLINYVTNGGENNHQNPTSYTYGEAKELYPATKRGSTFKGWYKNEGLTEKVESITSTMTGNLTLYAKWQENDYTITFDSKGGSTVESIVKKYNEEIEEPEAPTKEGYRFKGWYEDEEVTRTYTFDRMPDTNLTLYAGWTRDIYTVTFNTNGGSEISPVEVIYGNRVSKPADPEKEGYDFKDWYVDNNLQSPYIFSNTVDRDMTLFAGWEPHNYTITYDLNGGSASGNPNSYTIESAEITINNPSKTGHTFTGWSGTGITGTTTNLTIATGSKGDRNYTANYTANTYTISFNTNGGSEISPISGVYGEEVEAPENPAKEGYRFAGWYSDSDLTQLYTFTTMPAENLTLYAKWAGKEYVITYEVDGGVLDPESPSTYTHGDVTELFDATKEGYTFKGWYTDSEYTNKITEINRNMHEDITLYAKWEINEYTVTFNTNGGSEIASQTVTYNENIVRPENPEKDGYTFKGWYSNSDLTTPYEFGKMPARNLTLYAGWEAKEYTITFNTNGGSSVAPITAKYQSIIQAPTNPIKEGYRFAGWYSDEALTNLYSFTTMPKENITLYAMW
ncbi:MAG: InlB B-repeat-containing protein, partial [Clostridia bacterium]|nr:InlB B-repeat-containing protein [Clostridia bacterium]